ncbi:MAG: MBL fold metallo-hydrolase [Dysgonomonas sp.]
MRKTVILLLMCAFSCSLLACSNKTKQDGQINDMQNSTGNEDMKIENTIPSDIYPTTKGDLKVTLVGHGSLMFEFGGKVIHVDPYSKVADYEKLPKADLILITHEHADHLDSQAINAVKKDNTRFIVSEICNQQLGYGEVMKNGDVEQFDGIAITAVPAYNIVNKRPDGVFYHPKGRGNGYVLVFGDKQVYVGGDTENIPEMNNLKGKIEIAFLPKNLPYTMTDDMFVDAAKKVSPKYVYPYHFAEFDEKAIGDKLNGSGIKILVRPMSNK